MKNFKPGLSLLFLCITGIFLVSSAYGGTLKKFDSSGKELPDDAAEWAMVYDPVTKLYWEVKSKDDSIHASADVYKYSKAKKLFLTKLNEEKFGGFSDWRLPANAELESIKNSGGEEPLVNNKYFPNTMPSRYISLQWCGSESEFQPASVKFGEQKSKGGKYVRAVRGKPLEDGE